MRAALWSFAAGTSLLLVPEAARGVLAVAAATLVEAVPLLALELPGVRFQRCRKAVALLSCGCGGGPSARSLPAAAAAWLAFGPAVALGRLAAAHAVGRYLRAGETPRCEGGSALLDALRGLLPAALAAGAAAEIAAMAPPGALTPLGQIAGGTLLGFFAAPCGLGAVALAAALRVRAPLAAGAFLCVAGIVDLRAFARCRGPQSGADPLAYALLSAALGLVAWRHGAGLVHPMVAAIAGGAAIALAVACAVNRRHSDASARGAPALTLAGVLIAAPPPQYRATETTATDLFAGERLRFAGVLSEEGPHAALVRYAMTCCRADAAPVVVRLAARPSFPAGTWLRADGTVQWSGGQLQLQATAIRAVPPPPDPFLYR